PGRESGPRAGRDPAARPVSLPVRRAERLLAPDRPLECPQGTEDRSAIRQPQAGVLPLEERPVHAGGVLGGRVPARPLDGPTRLSSNDTVLLPIFPVPRHGLREGLTGFRAMNPAWGIDWGRFIDMDIRNYDGTPEDQKKRLQFAYRIDTSLVNPLGDLPPAVASNPSSLAQRNLERAWRLGLPSGQSVARAMRIKPLADKDIIIGKALDKPE